MEELFLRLESLFLGLGALVVELFLRLGLALLGLVGLAVAFGQLTWAGYALLPQNYNKKVLNWLYWLAFASAIAGIYINNATWSNCALALFAPYPVYLLAGWVNCGVAKYALVAIGITCLAIANWINLG